MRPPWLTPEVLTLSTFTRRTGYWNIKDPEHPGHLQYLQKLDRQAAQTLYNQEQQQLQEEERARQLPALELDTDIPPLSGDPTLSPFLTALPTGSPAFTEPRGRTLQDPSNSSDSEESEPSPREPSSEHKGQEEPILKAQLQYGLDVQDREPENPAAPEEPAYIQLVGEAAEFGLNVPPPLPIAQPVPQIQIQVPAIMAAQPAQAAAIPKGHLRGEPPAL